MTPATFHPRLPIQELVGETLLSLPRYVWVQSAEALVTAGIFLAAYGFYQFTASPWFPGGDFNEFDEE